MPSYEGQMKISFSKLPIAAALSLLNGIVIAGSPGCLYSTGCEEVWNMANATAISTNHGKDYINCNPDPNSPSRGFFKKGNQLIVYFSHLQGDIEKTCYVKFDIFSGLSKDQKRRFKQHGYVTATIKINGEPSILKRMWSSFWLVSPRGWPGYGEIDIVEYMADITNKHTDANLNGGPNGPNSNVSSRILRYRPDSTNSALGDLNVAHTYALAWLKQENTYVLSFWMDGNLVKVEDGTTSYKLKTNVSPDRETIIGLNEDDNNMQITFDTDDIAAINHYDKSVPDLKYNMEATDVRAYIIK